MSTCVFRFEALEWKQKESTQTLSERLIILLGKTHLGEILKQTVEAIANDETSVAALSDLLLRHGTY